MSKSITRDGGVVIIEKRRLSGSAVLRYTGFVKFYGEEKGRDYMKKLSAQKAAFRDSETGRHFRTHGRGQTLCGGPALGR